MSTFIVILQGQSYSGPHAILTINSPLPRASSSIKGLRMDSLCINQPKNCSSTVWEYLMSSAWIPEKCHLACFIKSSVLNINLFIRKYNTCSTRGHILPYSQQQKNTLSINPLCSEIMSMFSCQILAKYRCQLYNEIVTKGHVTHEPRAVTMKLWEPKRKCPKAGLR